MRMTTRVSPPVLGGVAAASADGVVIFVHYHLELIRFLASEHDIVDTKRSRDIAEAPKVRQ